MKSKKVIQLKDTSGKDVCIDIESIREVFQEIVEKMYTPIAEKIPVEACLLRKSDGSHWIINYPGTHDMTVYKKSLDKADYIEWLPLPKIP